MTKMHPVSKGSNHIEGESVEQAEWHLHAREHDDDDNNDGDDDNIDGDDDNNDGDVEHQPWHRHDCQAST